MSTETNKLTLTKNHLVVLAITTIVIFGWVIPNQTDKKPEPNINAQASFEVRTSEDKLKELEDEQKKLELEKAKVLKEKEIQEIDKTLDGLKVPAPVVDDKTELPKQQQNRDQIISTISSFIQQNGNPEVAKYSHVFYDECSKVNIHPYFCVAVAQADTSTGKNLTTAYNLGNVGNTDSCPICNPLKSWEEGIKAIAQTLNNDYLRNATKVCHLSRGGWKNCPEGAKINNGKFYASSTENWNRNSAWAFNWMLGKNWDDKQSIKFSDY